jgi:hypothetical protein
MRSMEGWKEVCPFGSGEPLAVRSGVRNLASHILLRPEIEVSWKIRQQREQRGCAGSMSCAAGIFKLHRL